MYAPGWQQGNAQRALLVAASVRGGADGGADGMGRLCGASAVAVRARLARRARTQLRQAWHSADVRVASSVAEEESQAVVIVAPSAEAALAEAALAEAALAEAALAEAALAEALAEAALAEALADGLGCAGMCVRGVEGRGCVSQTVRWRA